MVVYFTGTGNSRYCARMLADRLGDTCVDSFHFIRDGIAAELISDKPWVFVAPTYGWQLPRVFADFIRSGSFAGNRDAYIVMTCGGEVGNAMPENQALCAGKGLRYRGTLEVVMPENYIALFDAPEASEARKIIAAALPSLEKGIACIREGRDFPVPQVGLRGRLKSGIINKLFYRFIIKSKPFAASDACVGCGKCVKVCPLGNIQLKDGKPHWGDRCTHCMACICGCPAEAIEYGKASKGKPRYQCPAYQKGSIEAHYTGDMPGYNARGVVKIGNQTYEVLDKTMQKFKGQAGKDAIESLECFAIDVLVDHTVENGGYFREK